MNKKEVVGLSFLQALTLIFITLKLTDVIDWSWWYVLAPIWIPIILGLVILLIITLYVNYSFRAFKKEYEKGYKYGKK